MKKWMPLLGNFAEDQGCLIFQSTTFPMGEQQLFDSQSTNPLAFQIAPDGIVLFEDMVSSGSIEACVKFENFEIGDLAQIIFNYQNENSFMCAGVTNNLQKYSFSFVDGQQNKIICAAGFVEKLPVSDFHIKLELIGSFLALYVNDIRVITSAIPSVVNQTQVGIWVKSKGIVSIRNFKTNYNRPEAFIVSQFGDYYDVLYDEVIKPVCEELKYNPVRGDEVASCTLILNDIIASIRNASVVIADITPDNPNVFYEVGYAHALAKPTILLCEKGIRKNLPFDVSGFRTIFYDNSIGGKRQIEEKLKNHLQNINFSNFSMR